MLTQGQTDPSGQVYGSATHAPSRPPARRPRAVAAGRRLANGLRRSGTMAAWEHASPTASPPSPSPPRWPSTPRPRRSRPPAGRSSASAPASRTSPLRTTSSRPRSRPAATRSTTATRRSPGCPNCAPRSRRRRCATPATQVDATQVLVTNGGKQAVYNAFAALLDPGDEVLLIAPYWTTYPEAIKLAGGVPGRGHHRRDDAATWPPSSSSRPRARRARRCCCSSRRPTRPARSTRPTQVARDRPVGRRARASGWSPTRSTSTSSTATRSNVSIATEVPELGDRVVILNGVAKTYAMTGLAGRLADRPRPTSSRRPQPAVARDRRTSPTWRRWPRSPRSAATCPPSRDARGVRPAAPARSSACFGDIPGIVCPEPQGAFYVYPSVKGLLGRPLRGKVSHTSAELADGHPRRGRGRGRPGRGVRHARLPAAVLRARRRRPGRGCRPDRQAGRRRRLTDTASGTARRPCAGSRPSAGNCAHGLREVGRVDDPPCVGGDVAAQRRVPCRAPAGIAGRLQGGRSLVVRDEVVRASASLP